MEIKVYNNIFEDKFSTFEYNPEKPLIKQIENNLDVNFYKETLVECYDSETGETFYAPLEEGDENSSVIIIANGHSVDKDYIPQEHDLVSVFFTPASSSGGTSTGATVGAIIGAVVGAVAFGVMVYASGGLAAAGAPVILQAISVFASCVGLGYSLGLYLDLKNQNINDKTNKLNGAKEGASSPDVRGAENTSILNENFPFVIGKHLVTPRVIGDPVTVYSGEDGKDAYISTLLLVGYAPLKLTDFKLGDFFLAYNRDHTNSGGTVISHQTVINGLLKGYSSGGVADNGDIVDYWKHNDVQLEILQQNPNEEVNYGSIYPYAVDDQNVNANILYIADKALDEAALVSYKGASFPNKFRTNGVYFTTPCPKKFTITLQFPSGIYSSHTVTEEDGDTSVTNTVYSAIPLWLCVQWRIVNSGAAPSDPTGRDYTSWNTINIGTLRNFSSTDAAVDMAAHKGNDFGSSTASDVYQYFLDKQLNYFGDYSGEDHISEIRLSATVELSKAQCKQVIADTNPSKMIEIRVLRVSPNYMNQISSEGLDENEGMYSYSDLVKFYSVTTEIFDEQELRENDELVPVRPLSERDMRKFCLVAIKAKADESGYLINQLKKLNCVAESFSPYWDSTQKKMLPEGVVKKVTYYGYFDSLGNKVNRSDSAIEREVTKTEYEEGRQEGFSWYEEDNGSNFVDIIKNIVFDNSGTRHGQPYTYLSNNAKPYINNTVASGFMLACVGPQNGTVALGYDEINILTIGDWAERTLALKDGTTFNSDTVYNGVQYHKNDEVPIRFEANGYICGAIKFEGLLEKLAVAGRALWCVDETGKIKIVMDRPCDYVKGVISAQNCISSSNAFSYEKPPAGLFISFSDENDGYEKNQLYCWSDGNSIKNYHGEVEPYNVDFVTNAYQLWSIGRYMLAYRVLMKETLTRKIGVEGNTYSLGDVVMIQSEDLLIGDTSGRIQEILEDGSRIYGFITDAPFEYQGIDDSDGNSTQGITILQPGYLGKSKVVTLPIAGNNHSQTIGGVTYTQKKGTTNLVLIGTTDINHTVYGVLRDSSNDPSDGDVIKYNMKNGDICMFGIRDKISAPYRIVKIKPEKDGNFSETLLPYNEGLYNAGKMLPAFQNYITNPPVEDMLVSLSDVPTTIEEFNNALKSTYNSINAVINGNVNIGAPDLVTNLRAVAGMSNIAISWTAPANNGLKNIIKRYIVEISKRGGDDGTWVTVGSVYKSSFEYEYDRTNASLAVDRGTWAFGVSYSVYDVVTHLGSKYMCKTAHTSGSSFNEEELSNWNDYDGYMEREDFQNWRVRVRSENSCGQQSGWSLSTIDVNSYGTFKPCNPEIITGSCQVTRDEVHVRWNYSYLREPYATNLYKVYLYKEPYTTKGNWLAETDYAIDDVVTVLDETTNTVTEYKCTTAHTSGLSFDVTEAANWTVHVGLPMTLVSNEYAVYTFNRGIDGYPEVSDISKWSVRVLCYNSIYPTNSSYARISTASSVDYRDYGTWILTKPVISTKVTDRTVILKLSLSPRTDNKIPYGDIKYKVYIKKYNVDTDWKKPALDLDPYPEFDPITKLCIHDNENNYKVHVVNDKGEWESSTTYDVDDLVSVTENGNTTLYVCIETHVSGSEFDDTEAVSWAVYSNQFIYRGNWAPSTDYTTNDIVSVSSVMYACSVAHTSSSSFDTTEAANWMEYDDFVSSYDTYVQTLPLNGQGINELENTAYYYKVIAYNEAGESAEFEQAVVTALCTNIRDIVKAKQDAKELYISELSALSANIGAISEGTLGDSSNYWDLSTFIDDNGRQHYKGMFRVGDENEYLFVEPELNGQGIPTGKYKISFKMGTFEITTLQSRINGELIVQRDDQSLDRTRITPEGTFYEHRDSADTEVGWYEVAKMETAGLMTKTLYSHDSLIISNMNITERRSIGHDIGKAYLSNNGRCYHFDTDFKDQNGNIGYTIQSRQESQYVPRLVDGSNNEIGNPIDYTPAILSCSPYSEICKSLFGGYTLTHELGTTDWTIDFWIEYIYAENQTLFDVGLDQGDRIQIVISPGDPYYNYFRRGDEPFDPTVDDPPYNFNVMNNNQVVYNNVLAKGAFVYHIYGTQEEVFTLQERGVEFAENSWQHFAFVNDNANSKIKFYFQDVKVEFIKWSQAVTPGTAIFNREMNSFCLDELYVDTVPEIFKLINKGDWETTTAYVVDDMVSVTTGGVTTYYVCKVAHTSGSSFDIAEAANWNVLKNFDSFVKSTTDKVPWGRISDGARNFILDVDDDDHFFTNIFNGNKFATAVERVVSTGGAASCIIADSRTITGPELREGSNIKILFTEDVAASDTTTCMTIVYNGVTMEVKQALNGTFVDFTAKEIDGSFVYALANSRMDLVYINNCLTLGVTNVVESGNMNAVTSNAVYEAISSAITTVLNTSF